MNDNNTIFNSLSVTNNLICQYLHNNLFTKKMNLSPIQIKIIKYLSESKDGYIEQKNIGKIFSIRRSTVSGVLSTMEKNDIIERVSDKNNDKNNFIVFTKSFKKNKEIINEKINEFEMVLEKGMTKEELNMLFNILSKINENLMEERK